MRLTPKAVFLLIAIVVAEGYVVLSSELLAMRLLTAHVGNATDTISIIIAFVLMPLAFGYYVGGGFKPVSRNGSYFGIRDKILSNIFIANIFIMLATSYIFIDFFFNFLKMSGIQDRIALSVIYSAFFLVVPVFLLGQTVPLITNYFSKERFAKIAGIILFFSTIGSFLGAVFATVVLMSVIGVHHTAAANFVILTVSYLLLRKGLVIKPPYEEKPFILIGLTFVAIYINSDSAMKMIKVYSNNLYNTIQIYEAPDGSVIFSTNNSLASRLHPEEGPWEYATFIDEQFINPLLTKEGKDSYRILVIGAAGFTIGLNDQKNHYDFVDIDKNVKDVAERHFLKEPLSENKVFHPMDARAFLIQSTEKYDLIILDAFSGFTTPEHLVTREFFLSVYEALNDGGIVVGNFITDVRLISRYSQALDNTLRSVFPRITRHIIFSHGSVGSFWVEGNQSSHESDANILYIYKKHDGSRSIHKTIYTDNKNTYFSDLSR